MSEDQVCASVQLGLKGFIIVVIVVVIIIIMDILLGRGPIVALFSLPGSMFYYHLYYIWTIKDAHNKVTAAFLL